MKTMIVAFLAGLIWGHLVTDIWHSFHLLKPIILSWDDDGKKFERSPFTLPSYPWNNIPWEGTLCGKWVGGCIYNRVERKI